MSDLSATNCGCGCDSGVSTLGGNNSCLWIILLLICCGGLGRNGDGCGCGCGDNSCIWIILLLLCCGGCGDGCCFWNRQIFLPSWHDYGAWITSTPRFISVPDSPSGRFFFRKRNAYSFYQHILSYNSCSFCSLCLLFSSFLLSSIRLSECFFAFFCNIQSSSNSYTLFPSITSLRFNFPTSAPSF